MTRFSLRFAIAALTAAAAAAGPVHIPITERPAWDPLPMPSIDTVADARLLARGPADPSPVAAGVQSGLNDVNLASAFADYETVQLAPAPLRLDAGAYRIVLSMIGDEVEGQSAATDEDDPGAKKFKVKCIGYRCKPVKHRKAIDPVAYYAPVQDQAIEVIGSKKQAKGLLTRAAAIPKPLAFGILAAGALGLFFIVGRKK